MTCTTGSQSCLSKEITSVVKNILRTIIKSLLRAFWLFPVRSNRLCFCSWLGTKYNCNPKYISEYLLDDPDCRYEIGWLLTKNRLEYQIRSRVRVFRPLSLQGH
jgi:CDP-glycerol glycerophosphotransferase